MSKYDSFISYRRKTSMHLARNIFSELNRRNISAFLDVENIDATQFDTFILNQIAARPHFILLLSPQSLERCVNEGDWLLREIQHAYDLKRNIIPVYDLGFNWAAERHYLPENLQEFLPLQNAVSYTHEYYGAFIDKIVRFIRNPQQKAPIKVKAAPEEEAQQAQKMTQEALQVRFDDLTVIQMIGKYHELSEIAQTSTDWQDLLHIWGEIRASGNVPDFFEMEEEEAEARQALDEALKREEETRQYRLYVQEREQAYDFIRKLHQTGQIPVRRIRETLQNFWRKYEQYEQFYDPDNIAGDVKISVKSGTASADAIRTFIGEPFEWCEVPAGEFIYQDNQKLILPAFAIAKYPVTYAQFQTFVDAKNGLKDSRWWEGLAKNQSDTPDDQEWKISDHPRENVSWYDAIAFCRWLSWKLGGAYSLDEVNEWLVRLPTEFEWEKAARGTKGLIYPYGKDFDKSKCNTSESNIGKTSPVTQYPQGASPYGVLDMSGNVFEWCLTNYENPTEHPSQENISSNSSRVLRGGSWGSDHSDARAVFRLNDLAPLRNYDGGFRVCVPLLR